jgi:hypothetical protein
MPYLWIGGRQKMTVEASCQRRPARGMASQNKWPSSLELFQNHLAITTPPAPLLRCRIAQMAVFRSTRHFITQGPLVI